MISHPKRDLALINAAGFLRSFGKITALFSLDAFGGGFLTDALVAYWFFRRFGIAEQDLGVVFFAVHILNACSHLGAAWLARRIGLVNTMVFTHLPSSLPHGCAVGAFFPDRGLVVSLPRGAGRNGRSDAAVLPGGGGSAK